MRITKTNKLHLNIYGLIALIVVVTPILVILYWLASLVASQYLDIGNRYYAFDEQIHNAREETDRIFFENGLCTAKTSVNCTLNGPVYVYRKNNGFEVRIYGIHNQLLLEQISQLYINIFNNTPQMRQLKFSAYSISQEKSSGGWFINPILNIEMEREDE